MLLDVHTDRREEKPTVLLRRVPSAIAMDKGFVLLELHLGHLNASVVAISVDFLGIIVAFYHIAHLSCILFFTACCMRGERKGC